MKDTSDGDHSRVINHTLVPPVGEFSLDPAHTFVGFRAQHSIVGRVRGRFESVQGTIAVGEDPTASTVDVTIEAASITTLLPIRDEDLRSEHYLDVGRFPTVTYRSVTMNGLPAGAWLVTGELTLHGETRPARHQIQLGQMVMSGCALPRSQTPFGGDALVLPND